ncbi:MAG: metallophosphoesterase [Bacteroidota bacterium]
MMKWISIGDIHGRDNWKSIDMEQYDKVIFLGDYVDGREELNELENLEQIIDLKLNHPEKVVLLVGNHDLQYHWYSSKKLRVYKERNALDYQRLFKEYEKHFQLSYFAHDHFWVHGGITTRWIHFMQVQGHNFSDYTQENLSKHLNILFNQGCKELFSVGKARGGYDVGGPFWADISEMSVSAAPFHQVVGHNKTENPMHVELERGSFRMTDCLTYSNQFWVYEPDLDRWASECFPLK